MTRDRIPDLKLSPLAEASIIDEVAGQAEELYDSLIAQGHPHDDALAQALGSLDSSEAAWAALTDSAARRAPRVLTGSLSAQRVPRMT